MVWRDFLSFSSSPFQIMMLNPAYIIYMTATIVINVSKYWTISWIYSEADLSVSISERLHFITSIPCCVPHSSPSQKRTVGAQVPPPKLSINDAFTQYHANSIHKTPINNDLNICITQVLKFTFRKVYIKLRKSANIFLLPETMPNIRFLFWYTFMLCIFFVYIYMSGAYWAVTFILSLLFYITITYLFHRIWKYLRWNIALSITDFSNLFLYKVSLFWCLLWALMWFFMYYQNTISPAMMPRYTLSNWSQTIVFQAMSHIASEDFYQKVQRELRWYKQRWYVLYYEWVRSWNKENTQAFNKALGINFEPWVYENFSKLYGVSAQDNSNFLGLENNLDYNVDITIDEIMDIYNKKTQDRDEEEKKSFLQSWEVQDVNKIILEQLSSLNERQLGLLRYINQSLLNFMIKQEWLRNLIVEKVANQDLFSVILDERNEYVVSEIVKRWDEKIFILYWLMHFPGVLELLQQDDSNWNIISTEYLQIINQD